MSLESVKGFLMTGGVDLLRGILVLAVGFFIVHWLMRLLERNEKYMRIEPTFKGFLKNLIRIVLYILVILTAANTMGIPMTSVVTLVASAGVAVSLAMQGVLSNLIGGLILLILKPIRVGEFVKIGNDEGTVEAVGVYYTEMATPDNKRISIPNGSITNTPIVNYTRQGTRRLDLVFSVSYDSDMDRVYTVLRQLLAEEEAILPEPEPTVNLSNFGESSLDYSMRVWVKSADYWPARFSLLEKGKRALDKAGVTIPYPQMDVHIKTVPHEREAAEDGMKQH